MTWDSRQASSLVSYFVEAGAIAVRRVRKEDIAMLLRKLVQPWGQQLLVSLILRGANDYMLDEMERVLHDALSIVKSTLESNMVVACRGAVESALSVYSEYLATTMGLDFTNGTICDNLNAGVVEPATSKLKITQFATEAAITVLRIDDMVKLFKDESQNDEE
ncbi:hypothetical protein SLE2022_177850 [Rubroshorea leprosula]